MDDCNQKLSDEYLKVFEEVDDTFENLDYKKLNALLGSLIEASVSVEGMAEEEIQDLRENVMEVLNDHSHFGVNTDTSPPLETIKERIDALSDQRTVVIYMVRDLLVRKIPMKSRGKIPNMSKLATKMMPFIK